MSESATEPRPRPFYTEPQWADVGDVRVAYRRRGTGAPTLFLHGAGGTRMWLPFYERMAASVPGLIFAMMVNPWHAGVRGYSGPNRPCSSLK